MSRAGTEKILGYYEGWAVACQEAGLTCTSAVVPCDSVMPMCSEGRCVDAARP